MPLEASEEMVEALKKCGGNVRFTIYPEAGHDAWTQTYADPQLYQWLLQQKRTEKKPDELDKAGPIMKKCPRAFEGVEGPAESEIRVPAGSSTV